MEHSSRHIVSSNPEFTVSSGDSREQRERRSDGDFYHGAR